MRRQQRKHFLAYILMLLFSFFQASGQENEKLKVNNNDSSYQSYLNELKNEAILKRSQLEKKLGEADPDTVLVIRISNLYYRSIPEISRFNRLKDFRAQNNQIRKIDRKAFKSDSLKSINFSNNKVRRVRLGRQDQLVYVRLDENELKRIPGSIRKLQNLEVLDLADNRIRRIPKFLKKLDHLKEINLNFNDIRLTKKAIRRLAGINTILLAANGFDSLPENIHELGDVKKLNFSKNQLSSLPKSFGQLDSLTNLIFYQNSFKEIPEQVFELENLQEIDFYYNNLSDIPEEIGKLTGLQQIFLSFNQISRLPDTMASLRQIKYLYIHHNQLIALPEWITQMDKLERLDVSYNKLFAIPDLSGLASLSEIDIQENQLEYFPWGLLEKKNLKSLVVRGNPFILSTEERNMLKTWNDNSVPGRLILVY